MGKLIEFYKNLHATTEYGLSGHRKVQLVHSRIAGNSPVLDYGCGSGGLVKLLKERQVDVDGYDPCVPGVDKIPDRKYMAVVSTDVLEHVPYDEIDDVLAHIISLTGRRGFHHINSSPASLLLPDGSNAHVIQENAVWWTKKFTAHGVKVIEAFDQLLDTPTGKIPFAANITFDVG